MRRDPSGHGRGTGPPCYDPPVDEAAEAIEAAWRRVEEAWDAETAHTAYLTLCASTGRLAEAGRRYREVRERDAGRAALAAAQIDRVLGLAMQSLAAIKTEPNPRSARTKLLLVAVGVSGAMIASALLALLRFF